MLTPARQNLFWYLVTVSCVCTTIIFSSAVITQSDGKLFHRRLFLRQGETRVKSLNQPCTKTNESIAVCITGEKRVFHKRIWKSILQNVRLSKSHQSCVHHFIVLERPLHVKTPLPGNGASGYWTEDIIMGSSHKNSKLLPMHQIINDFHYQEADAILSGAELYDEAYDKSGYVNVSHTTASQAGKFTQCAEMVAAQEAAQGWDYGYIFRIRPDAIWFTPLYEYTDADKLAAAGLLKGHSDTSWFAKRDSVKGSAFLPAGGQGVRVAWAMCRLPQTLGTYYTYLNSFFQISPKNGGQLASLCYRLRMMFGMLGDGRPAELDKYDFRKEVSMWIRSNQTSDRLTGVCSDLAPLLDSAPAIKHDVEICSYWGSAVFQPRVAQKINDFKVWFAEAANTALNKANDVECTALFSISCEMLRALQYLAMASVGTGPNPKDDISSCIVPPVLRTAGPCNLVKIALNVTQQSTDNVILCYHKLLQSNSFARLCARHITVDHYYWDNPYGWAGG